MAGKSDGSQGEEFDETKLNGAGSRNDNPIVLLNLSF